MQRALEARKGTCVRPAWLISTAARVVGILYALNDCFGRTETSRLLRLWGPKQQSDQAPPTCARIPQSTDALTNLRSLACRGELSQMRALRMLLYAYGVVGVLSLLVIPVCAKGWFGLEPDPLAAVFAIVLASPWGLPLLGMLPSDSPWLAGILLAACMSFNLLLGNLLLRWLRRRAERNRAGSAELRQDEAG